jgi:hypothetical protein
MEKETKATFRDMQGQINKLRERIGKIEKVERSFQTNCMIQIESSLAMLEKKIVGLGGQEHLETIDLSLTLPEADIDGLRFNEQKVHGVFELKEDGKYYSRDILIHSARDTDEGTSRDLLSEYLESINVKQAFYQAFCNKYTAEPLFKMGLKRVPDINVSLPEANQGVKKYNGVRWWYWLRPRSSGSAASFSSVGDSGGAGNPSASSVGGCAPAFCVAHGRGADVS